MSQKGTINFRAPKRKVGLSNVITKHPWVKLLCVTVLYLQIELDLFDAASSSTASLVSCSDPPCASVVQTTAAVCSTQGNRCAYSFQYGDGSGTSGYYVNDLLYFDMVLGPSSFANSSASVVFG